MFVEISSSITPVTLSANRCVIPSNISCAVLLFQYYLFDTAAAKRLVNGKNAVIRAVIALTFALLILLMNGIVASSTILNEINYCPKYSLSLAWRESLYVIISSPNLM